MNAANKARPRSAGPPSMPAPGRLLANGRPVASHLQYAAAGGGGGGSEILVIAGARHSRGGGGGGGGRVERDFAAVGAPLQAPARNRGGGYRQPERAQQLTRPASAAAIAQRPPAARPSSAAAVARGGYAAAAQRRGSRGERALQTQLQGASIVQRDGSAVWVHRADDRSP